MTNATIVAGLSLALCLNGCGVSNGGFTIGSTGYLAEANRVRLASLAPKIDRPYIGAVIPKHLRKELAANDPLND